MIIYKAYQFRIYPNQAQALLIHKTIGCSQFVCNSYLYGNTHTKNKKGWTYGTGYRGRYFLCPC
ncbi:hypothetical protein ABE15_09940 [Bacillus cereus]|nr:hypothetical protein [Bacillus cereus]